MVHAQGVTTSAINGMRQQVSVRFLFNWHGGHGGHAGDVSS
jgi:hypothetical protein